MVAWVRLSWRWPSRPKLSRAPRVERGRPAGVIALTKALAKELARTGILVNAIAPAVIGTELLQQMKPETIQYMVDRVPLGRMGTPAEVATLVHFPASGAGLFSSGFGWDLSGGRAISSAVGLASDFRLQFFH